MIFLLNFSLILPQISLLIVFPVSLGSMLCWKRKIIFVASRRGMQHRRKLGPAVKIKTPAHPAKLLWMRNKSAQQRANRREWESEGEREWWRRNCHMFCLFSDTWHSFCVLYFSQVAADIPSPTYMYVCVLQATPSTLTRRSPPPPCCSCTRCVLLAKFATAFCRDKPKSEAEEIGNLILFSCPATPQHSRSPVPVPLSPSFNACHFCPFSAVSFSPRTVCAKNLIIETLSELEKWNDTNENQPQSDKAVNDGG